MCGLTVKLSYFGLLRWNLKLIKHKKLPSDPQCGGKVDVHLMSHTKVDVKHKGGAKKCFLHIHQFCSHVEEKFELVKKLWSFAPVWVPTVSHSGNSHRWAFTGGHINKKWVQSQTELIKQVSLSVAELFQWADRYKGSIWTLFNLNGNTWHRELLRKRSMKVYRFIRFILKLLWFICYTSTSQVVVCAAQF